MSSLPLYTLGLIYLLFTTLLWSLSSLLVSSTLSSFPFLLLTYISTLPFVLLLPFRSIVASRSLSLPLLLVGLKLSTLWFASNALYYLSLQTTTVTSSTVLSTTSAAMTYAYEARGRYTAGRAAA
eukprot:CAMPEP_0182456146 /NCGR_PEP_ID=MMETSP1319-20130603/2070_1 /TAXON_ID=172717 /ORGANISM="Bolidomonas pacifica, Strain RCC208" /LENGTH=124 /DNA_ID=CAMNT_0024654325 /DNA_START=163 /DNA_END=534 /DNA_ORIENTATION=-